MDARAVLVRQLFVEGSANQGKVARFDRVVPGPQRVLLLCAVNMQAKRHRAEYALPLSYFIASLLVQQQ